MLKPDISEKARALISAHGPLPTLLRSRPTPLPLPNIGLGTGPSVLGGSVSALAMFSSWPLSSVKLLVHFCYLKKYTCTCASLRFWPLAPSLAGLKWSGRFSWNTWFRFCTWANQRNRFERYSRFQRVRLSRICWFEWCTQPVHEHEWYCWPDWLDKLTLSCWSGSIGNTWLP